MSWELNTAKIPKLYQPDNVWKWDQKLKPEKRQNVKQLKCNYAVSHDPR